MFCVKDVGVVYMLSGVILRPVSTHPPSRNRVVVKTGAERKERKEITSICISFVVVLFSRAICAANATDLCRAIYGVGGIAH